MPPATSEPAARERSAGEQADQTAATDIRLDLGHGLSLWQLLVADFHGFLALDQINPVTLRRRLDVLTQPGFWSVVTYRLGAACHRVGFWPLARLFHNLNIMLFGAEINPRAQAGPGLVIPHPVCVGVAAGTRIGRNVQLFKGITLGAAGHYDPSRVDGFPTIGDNCRIMDGAKIFGPIQIGDGSTIGANAFVMESVPPGALVVSPLATVRRVRPRRDDAAAGAS